MSPTPPTAPTKPALSPSPDFRDRLATADVEGRRRWLYPVQPRGRYYRARTWVAWGLLAVMFGGPFVKIHGNPLLLVNLVERKFSVLGVIFWPQDNLVFALGFLLFLTGIAVFTAGFGRLWCGWTCPQTVLMEMVFRKLEYWIDGSAATKRLRDRAPWSAAKTSRKIAKQVLFFVLSFLIANTLLAYLIGIEDLQRIVTDDPRRHLAGLGALLIFTFVFYAIFARFREQACTFICPYGRLQSTLLDENSIVVAYDYKRGEQRAPLRRPENPAARTARRAGDCIDCLKCVSVCPTGIDIRNGTQMECVNCTACIDACDDVMDRIRRPRGLIRFASLDGIERGQPLRVTPRILGYCAILAALAAALAALLLTRSDVDTTLLRAPGALFDSTPGGQISNLYLLKLINKTRDQKPVVLKLENIAGSLTVLGAELNLPPQKQISASVVIEIAPDKLSLANTPIQVGVYCAGKRIEKIKTIFIGPRR